jgi:hypothetical protein
MPTVLLVHLSGAGDGTALIHNGWFGAGTGGSSLCRAKSAATTG